MTTTNEQIAALGPFGPLLAPVVAINNLLFPQKEEEKVPEKPQLSLNEILRRQYAEDVRATREAELITGFGGTSRIHENSRVTHFF